MFYYQIWLLDNLGSRETTLEIWIVVDKFRIETDNFARVADNFRIVADNFGIAVDTFGIETDNFKLWDRDR